MSRVNEYLEEKGIPYESLPHDPTFTAIDEAGELKVAADNVLKTLVLRTHDGGKSRHPDLPLLRRVFFRVKAISP